MNLYDLILIAVIAAVFLLALRKTVSNYKKVAAAAAVRERARPAAAVGAVRAAPAVPVKQQEKQLGKQRKKQQKK